jgi:predicted dehydrogenase
MNGFSKLDYHDLISVPREEFEITNSLNVREVSKDSGSNGPSLRKLIFFIFREGLLRTFYKFRSAKIYKKTSAYGYFISGFHQKSGYYYAGMQISIRQPVFYFHPLLRFRDKPEMHDLEEWFCFDPFRGYIKDACGNVSGNGNFLPITFIKQGKTNTGKSSLYIIGAGRYALTEILPVFRSYNMKGLCDFNFELLQNEIFGEFELKTNDFETLIEYAKADPCPKVFIIASYHSYHTFQAVRALDTENSKVVIEKPPCVTMDDFQKLLAIYDEKRIYIAYHRRFAGWNLKLRNILHNARVPVNISMLIREITISPQHWYFAPNQGTRISGNLCHWIDLAYFWINKKPAALMITRNTILGIDSSLFNILFEDGTLVNLVASDKGDGTNGVQEHITVRGEGIDVHIGDYVKLDLWYNGKKRHYSGIRRDKGHMKMNKYYTGYVQNNVPSPYSRRDFILTTFTYIRFVEMWEKGEDNFVFGNDFFTSCQIR